jgi:hypothetical protein
MKKKNDCWNLLGKKYIVDRKTGSTRIKIRVPFSFGRGGSMTLDMYDIGKAIYESILY